MRGVAAVAGLALVAVGAGIAEADEVYLKGGGRLVGVIVERSAQSVLMDVGPGQVSVPLARVDHVVSGPSPLAIYRERAARLARTDVESWLDLAAWAADRELTTQSREAYEHVLRIDPRNATAHLALGHVSVSGQWMTLDESYRARGYVPFEGSWVLPEERAAILKERVEEGLAERARIEADARAREAEARARAAEAEARRAEIEAGQAATAVPAAFGPFVGLPGDFTTFGGVVIGQSPLLPHCATRRPSVLLPPVTHRGGVVTPQPRHHHHRN
jgi:hypothetical protein